MAMTQARQKQWVLAAYVLQGLGPLLVFASAIAGLVISYLHRGESQGPYRSHHRWLIQTFWWSVLGWFVGVLTTGILLGWLILFVTGIWWLYRMIRGLLRLSENRPPLG